jgi:hypothetical protein
MAEIESRNTMLQNSFIKNGDGDYAIKTAPANPTLAYATSSNSSGVVTSPGAGASIAATSSVSAGVYDVTVTVFITGTTATADINNCRLTAAGNSVGRIIAPINGTSGANSNAVTTFRVNMGSNGTFAVIAVGAGTTGAIYAASVIANRVA